MKIELKGFGGYGWSVCDTCPCDHERGCYFEYSQQPGQMHLATGKLFPYDGPAKQSGKTVASGYYYVTIRPQECIDKHGR